MAALCESLPSTEIPNEEPRARVKKYLHVLNIGIQNQLVYRVNFLFRACFSILPLIATISLWRTVYEGGSGTISGYTLAQMVSYYLVVTLVDMLTAVNEDDWQIAADIREGNISQFLVKPIDYLKYRLCLFIGGRAIYTAVALVPTAIFIYFQREYFVAPADLATVGWFTVSIVMTALLQFFTAYAMALLAFWVLEVSTFIFILFAFEYIAGGHLFPLDILPPALSNALAYTPFPYQMFFPVSIYVGKSTGFALYQGLVIQFFWLVAAYFFARFMWARGIRKYAAVGG
jgi:ABC-2 type transport system permease protein